MKNLFKYIRRQPKNIRNRYALTFSSVFVLLIIALWLPAQFSGDETKKVAEVTEQENLPFATLLKSIKDQFATARDSIVSEEYLPGQEKTEDLDTVGEFTLTSEEIIDLRRKLEETSNESFVPESSEYEVVLIATTSASSALETIAD